MNKLIIVLLFIYYATSNICTAQIYYNDCVIINDVCQVNNKPYSGKILSPSGKGWIDVRNGIIMAVCCTYPNGNIAEKRVITSKDRAIYYYDTAGNVLLEQNIYEGFASKRKLYRDIQKIANRLFGNVIDNL